jgi:hypothetical protein
MSLTLTAAQIVLMNLRDGLPDEPARLRSCVVIEDPDLFGDAYANVIVVPLTHDRVASFSLVMTTIDPTPENGCDDRSYALAAHVASYSRNRIVNATKSRVTDEQLAIVRAQVALVIAA